MPRYTIINQIIKKYRKIHLNISECEMSNNFKQIIRNCDKATIYEKKPLEKVLMYIVEKIRFHKSQYHQGLIVALVINSEKLFDLFLPKTKINDEIIKYVDGYPVYVRKILEGKPNINRKYIDKSFEYYTKFINTTKRNKDYGYTNCRERYNLMDNDVKIYIDLGYKFDDKNLYELIRIDYNDIETLSKNGYDFTDNFPGLIKKFMIYDETKTTDLHYLTKLLHYSKYNIRLKNEYIRLLKYIKQILRDIRKLIKQYIDGKITSLQGLYECGWQWYYIKRLRYHFTNDINNILRYNGWRAVYDRNKLKKHFSNIIGEKYIEHVVNNNNNIKDYIYELTVKLDLCGKDRKRIVTYLVKFVPKEIALIIFKYS